MSILQPKVTPTKYSLAMIPMRKNIDVPGEPQRFTVDWRALERNKYAPWGRGKLV